MAKAAAKILIFAGFSFVAFGFYMIDMQIQNVLFSSLWRKCHI